MLASLSSPGSVTVPTGLFVAGVVVVVASFQYLLVRARARVRERLFGSDTPPVAVDPPTPVVQPTPVPAGSILGGDPGPVWAPRRRASAATRSPGPAIRSGPAPEMPLPSASEELSGPEPEMPPVPASEEQSGPEPETRPVPASSPEVCRLPAAVDGGRLVSRPLAEVPASVAGALGELGVDTRALVRWDAPVRSGSWLVGVDGSARPGGPAVDPAVAVDPASTEVALAEAALVAVALDRALVDRAGAEPVDGLALLAALGRRQTELAVAGVGHLTVALVTVGDSDRVDAVALVVPVAEGRFGQAVFRAASFERPDRPLPPMIPMTHAPVASEVGS